MPSSRVCGFAIADSLLRSKAVSRSALCPRARIRHFRYRSLREEPARHRDHRRTRGSTPSLQRCLGRGPCPRGRRRHRELLAVTGRGDGEAPRRDPRDRIHRRGQRLHARVAEGIHRLLWPDLGPRQVAHEACAG